MESFNPDMEKLMEAWTNGVLVLALDFGVTFTGISYSVLKSPSEDRRVDPTTIVSWPGQGIHNWHAPKTPSAIAYENGTCFWGHPAMEKHNVIQWFKLFLMDENLPDYLKNSPRIQQVSAIIQSSGKTAVEVAADYFRKVFEHSLEQIRHARGDSLKHAALRNMERALELSGILDVRPNGVAQTTYKFVTEPEAASMVAIPDLDGWDNLFINDSFVVVDMGGGTVDCISYTVNDIGPLRIREVVEGDGDLCGAWFVDQEFQTAIQKKVMEEGGIAFEELGLSDQRTILNTWEYAIKRDFDTEYDVVRQIGPFLTPDNRRIFLHISPDEILHMFEPVKARIEALVRRQVEAIEAKNLSLPKYIVLVGGFGESPFLRSSLELAYKGRITILQEAGDKPSSAVSRGGVVCGTHRKELLVRSRVSRYSYGYPLQVPFQEGVHHPNDKTFDASRGCYMADDQMKWIVKRGDEVGQRVHREFPYERRFRAEQGGHPLRGFQEWTVEIWESERANPPSRKAALLPDEDFMVSKSFTMRTPVPVEQLKKVEGEGEYWYVLEYDLKVEVSGACINLSAKWADDKSIELVRAGLGVVLD
ncbi:hypothetical protein F5Y13DRAFT_196492 [Hypoxylon sp. FL1857]|nr:hypothetical protein F5Y13DRAFT_196492 [Hypoxylon sp. FL1857]